MRSIRNRGGATNRRKREVRPAERENERIELDAQISALEQKAQDLGERLLQFQAIINALREGVEVETAFGAYVKNIRESYPSACVEELASAYELKESELISEQKILHTETVSVFKDLLARTKREDSRARLWEAERAGTLLSLDSPTIELLGLLRRNVGPYLDLLRREKTDARKERQRLKSVQDFRSCASEQVNEIIDKVNALGRSLEECELMEILSGAAATCLDKLPSGRLLETMSDYSEELRKSFEVAAGLRDKLIKEFEELMCLEKQEGRECRYIVSPARIREIRVLKESFESEWETVFSSLPWQDLRNISTEQLREFLELQKRVSELRNSEILLPSRLRKISVSELLRREDPRSVITSLESLYPEFVQKLDPELYKQMGGAYEAVKSGLDKHYDSFWKGVDRDLVADIIVFGVFNFGAYKPFYSLQELYERMRKRGAYDESLTKFITLFDGKLLQMEYPFFMASLESKLQASSRVYFCGCSADILNTDCGYQSLMELSIKMGQYAESGDEFSSLICFSRNCFRLAGSLIHMARFFNGCLRKIRELPADLRGDTQILSRIINSAKACGDLISCRHWSPENHFLSLLRDLSRCFKEIYTEDFQRDRNFMGHKWAKESGAEDLLEAVYFECEQVKAWGSRLESLWNRSEGIRLSEWREFFQAFESIYDSHAEDLFSLQKKAENLMARVEVWWRQFDE